MKITWGQLKEYLDKQLDDTDPIGTVDFDPSLMPGELELSLAWDCIEADADEGEWLRVVNIYN